MRKNIHLVVSLLAFSSILSLPGIGYAKSDRRTPYSRQEVYRTFVRLLRVDLNYKILEKDLDGGYVIFEYRDAIFKRTSPASLEIIDISEPGGPGNKGKDSGTEMKTKLVMEIKNCGSSDEIQLLNQLVSKLKDEYGKR
ncbi:MAG: hypothetical protein GXP49_11685 [Deltaproteobacteria bacterium]|nr:hypothetical protein [Deltaproteobacteria bacterium]